MKSPNYKTDAATIVVMALFTVVLEFDGGTYISQVRAASAHLAAIKHVALLASNKTIGPTRKRLAVRLAGDKPVGIKRAAERLVLLRHSG